MLARTVSISCISSCTFRYSGYSFFPDELLFRIESVQDFQRSPGHIAAGQDIIGNQQLIDGIAGADAHLCGIT